MMKNFASITDGVLLVRTPLNGMIFTASLADTGTIGQHRWRYANTAVITEITGSIVELGHFLLGLHPDADVEHANGNHLDFTRENLDGVKKLGSPSVITQHGKTSTLHLNHGVSVRFDTEKTTLVDSWRWYAVETYGKMVVRANSGIKKIQLHRILVGDACIGKCVTYGYDGKKLDMRAGVLRIKRIGSRRDAFHN